MSEREIEVGDYVITPDYQDGSRQVIDIYTRYGELRVILPLGEDDEDDYPLDEVTFYQSAADSETNYQ